MPYQATWVDPEIFVTISLDDGRSVPVYHTYTRDDVGQGASLWCVTLDKTSDECDRTDIDLRTIDSRICSTTDLYADKELYVEVITKAILSGQIVLPDK